jgi:cysteinyl-tRNA synthetase
VNAITDIAGIEDLDHLTGDLRLFDTARQRKRVFQSLVPGRVSMYVCGATVQAPPHIGHMRSAVAFDLLRRWLMTNGYAVTFVRNVTDIDDKILDRATQTGEPWWAIATAVERDFEDAYRAMDCLPPTIEPRATGHIPDMIALTQRLIASGAAYAQSGSVYFSVARAVDYGGLSGQNIDHLRRDGANTHSNAPTAITSDAAPDDLADARTAPNGKKDPRDFALWKGAKPGEPATAAWETPWGKARPGWHLECSAMSTRYLGPAFDIHGGGRDLIFPHHENERAQSRTAGDEFARYWVHNAWVTVGGEKMSKSLNNSLLVRELLTTWSPRHLRYWLVSGHYRSILEYSPQALRDAAAASTRIETFLTAARERYPSMDAAGLNNGQSDTPGEPASGTWKPAPRPASDWADRFTVALNDDLNTAQALAVVHDAVRIGNLGLKDGNDTQVQEAFGAVKWMTDILGIATTGPQPAPNAPSGSEVDKLIGVLVELRDDARRRRDYEWADLIRQRLTELDVELVDTPTGSTWRQR